MPLERPFFGSSGVRKTTRFTSGCCERSLMCRDGIYMTFRVSKSYRQDLIEVTVRPQTQGRIKCKANHRRSKSPDDMLRF
jgi:hypothetical protein